jgi:alcohol dehydrogenase class IV
MVSFRPTLDDLTAIDLIRKYLGKKYYVPHGQSASMAIRYALRFSIAVIAEQEQKAARHRRVLRRAKRKHSIRRK